METKKGRKRIHATDAERQAAYRERKRNVTSPNVDELARELHAIVKDAARRGSPQAEEMLGKGKKQTLTRVTAYIKEDFENWFRRF